KGRASVPRCGRPADVRVRSPGRRDGPVVGAGRQRGFGRGQPEAGVPAGRHTAARGARPTAGRAAIPAHGAGFRSSEVDTLYRGCGCLCALFSQWPDSAGETLTYRAIRIGSWRYRVAAAGGAARATVDPFHETGSSVMPSVRKKLAAVTAVAAGAALVLGAPGAGAAPKADQNLPKKLVKA